jgi:integrase
MTTKRGRAGKASDEWYFPASVPAGPLRAAVFRRAAFDNAATEIGVPGLHPYELRHTAASLAIASGANVKVMQRMLSHKSATMTHDQYGHLFGDQLDTVADALDGAARAAGVYPVCTDATVTDLDSARGLARGQ